LILQEPASVLKQKALKAFYIQLFLNFWCSFIFFKFQMLGVELIEIGLMWIAIINMILIFKKVNKTAAYLQVPYLLWVSFVTILNASLWWLN